MDKTALCVQSIQSGHVVLHRAASSSPGRTGVWREGRAAPSAPGLVGGLGCASPNRPDKGPSPSWRAASPRAVWCERPSCYHGRQPGGAIRGISAKVTLAPSGSVFVRGRDGKYRFMRLIYNLARLAARELVQNRELRAKTVNFVTEKVAPQAKAGWVKAKPRVDRARSAAVGAAKEVAEVARRNDPREDPRKFLSEASRRLRDRAKR